MKGYAEREVFTAAEIELLAAATALVNKLPHEEPSGKAIRCHELARAVGIVLELPVQDGFSGLVDHSWLWTRRFDGTPGVNILDVYCVGRLPQVQILSAEFQTGHWLDRPTKYARSLYRTMEHKDIREYLKSDPEFEEKPWRATINELGGIGPMRDDVDQAVVAWLVSTMRSGQDPS